MLRFVTRAILSPAIPITIKLYQGGCKASHGDKPVCFEGKSTER